MLTRDEALKICETVLAHAKAAGAEDAVVSLQSIGRVARAVCRQPHHHQRPLRGSRHHRHRLGRQAARRRRPATTPSAAALKQLADEAVQIARVSPVHREYVPTLGPLDYAGVARLRRRDRRRRSSTARATALEACSRACRDGEGDRRRLSHARRASATAAATANGNRRYFRSSEAGLSVTARSADGTGSGYFAGDHFDLARLDAQHIAEQAVEQGGALARSRSRSSRASIR